MVSQSVFISASDQPLTVFIVSYHKLLIIYNNQINAHALIGQSAMAYWAGKLVEKSRIILVIV